MSICNYYEWTDDEALAKNKLLSIDIVWRQLQRIADRKIALSLLFVPPRVFSAAVAKKKNIGTPIILWSDTIM